MRKNKETCPAKKLLGFDDKWLMIIGIPTVALITSLMMFHKEIYEHPEVLPKIFFVSLVYVFLFWMALRAAMLFYRKRYFVKELNARELLLQIAFILMTYAVVNVAIDLFLKDKLIAFCGIEHDTENIGMTISSLVVSFLVLAIYQSIFFYHRYQGALLEQEQLKKEQIASQLQSLKNQVNPHFLFNSMNTLAQLIPEDSERAVKFVEKLSKVYRYILEIKDKELVSLSEEMRFLYAYLFLLKERFEDNLQVDIQVPDEYLNKKILPLSLQLLIENAIKHNITSSEQPLIIYITINEDKLIIKNKLQRKKQVSHSTKTGLENVQKRYSFFTKVSVQIKETTEYFSVALPLIV